MADVGISNHVKKRYAGDLEGLFTAGERATELVNHGGWIEVQDVLTAEIAGIDSKLEAHEPLSRAEYAMLVGRRAGLKASREAADAIVRICREEYEKQKAKHEAGGESPAGT